MLTLSVMSFEVPVASYREIEEDVNQFLVDCQLIYKSPLWFLGDEATLSMSATRIFQLFLIRFYC